MIPKPTMEEDDDEMSVQNIGFVPKKAWAASYFLDPMFPWIALRVF
jgi:hypothetical protein